MEKLNHLTFGGLFQPELSHDPKIVWLSHPVRLSPKYSAHLMIFFFNSSQKPAPLLALAFPLFSSTVSTAANPFPCLHITWARIGYLKKITDLMKKFRNTKLTNEINKFIVFPAWEHKKESLKGNNFQATEHVKTCDLN